MQTLTELYLYNNEIGVQGAHDLAQALQNNTVKYIFFVFIIYTLLDFYTDPYQTLSSLQWNRLRSRTTTL